MATARRTIEIPNGWDPRRYQLPLWKYLQDGGKRAVAVWHRRAGKDSCALNWTAAEAIEGRVGVYIRLGFAVAVAAEPDVLLIDEVLAVGDEAFTRRCLDRLARMRQAGVTMVELIVAMGLLALAVGTATAGAYVFGALSSVAAGFFDTYRATRGVGDDVLGHVVDRSRGLDADHRHLELALVEGEPVLHVAALVGVEHQHVGLRHRVHPVGIGERSLAAQVGTNVAGQVGTDFRRVASSACWLRTRFPLRSGCNKEPG